ncbi:MAG: hypothetical protein IJ193_08180 [Bacilli bacterium]|nr:hypothetical protein [Bacilli bacterium]
MTIDETEVNRVRFEDLSDELQTLINSIASYNTDAYSSLRSRIANLADKMDMSTSVYAGNVLPPVIKIGKTVYFDGTEANIRIASESGDWMYLK